MSLLFCFVFLFGGGVVQFSDLQLLQSEHSAEV